MTLLDRLPVFPARGFVDHPAVDRQDRWHPPLLSVHFHCHRLVQQLEEVFGQLVGRKQTRHLRWATHRIERARAFQDLPGVGPLAVYDVSDRIGSYLGIRPEKVYLHCGVRQGARALGLPWRQPTVGRSLIPLQSRLRRSNSSRRMSSAGKVASMD